MDQMLIDIEVVYAAAENQHVISLQVPEGFTVEEVIKQSRILEKCPEIDLKSNKVGIFSKIVSLATLVAAGDRVEIYRPLLIDPKIARKQRASRVAGQSSGESHC